LKQTDPDHGIKTHLPDSDICLPDLDFADDIVTFDSNETNAGEHVHNIQSAAAAVGLKINRDKTKILLVNCDLSERLPKSLENLEIVDDFKYLGSTVASSYNDFKRRRGIAWSQFWKLEKVWRSTKISLKLKLRLFDSLIISILLYGAESWTTTQQLKNELNSFGTSCYRIILNIKRIDRVTNQHILNVTQRKNLFDIFLQKQLRALGHWLRRPIDTTIRRYALYTTNQGKNRRGRPRNTYVNSMQKLTQMNNEALIQLAEDREEWRRFVVDRFDPQPAD